MRKKTLGTAFAELRAKSGLTMLETGLKCDLAEPTIWKLENDRSVRWETVHTVLSVAFNTQPGSERYENFHLLWLKSRQNMAENHPEGFAKPKLSKHATEATRKFRNLVRDLSPDNAKKVLAAATRAARSL